MSLQSSNTIRWVVYDREKFAGLVQDLRELIDDLESLTDSLKTVLRRFNIIRHELDDLVEEDVELLMLMWRTQARFLMPQAYGSRSSANRRPQITLALSRGLVLPVPRVSGVSQQSHMSYGAHSVLFVQSPGPLLVVRVPSTAPSRRIHRTRNFSHLEQI